MGVDLRSRLFAPHLPELIHCLDGLWACASPEEPPLTPAELFAELIIAFVTQDTPSAGAFTTPSSLDKLLTELVEPEEGLSLYDPAAGTGLTLFECIQTVTSRGGSPSDLAVAAPDINAESAAIGKALLWLAGVREAEYRLADVLSTPLVTPDNQLRQFDRIVCDPPWGIKVRREALEHDPFGRFLRGEPRPSGEGPSCNTS